MARLIKMLMEYHSKIDRNYQLKLVLIPIGDTLTGVPFFSRGDCEMSNTNNDLNSTQKIKRPGSLFCRKLPVGNDKHTISYRRQEYAVESLLVVVILLIALRIVERNTALMDGLYGTAYIGINILIDIVLLVIVFLVLHTVYESRLKKFNVYLDSNPEVRKQVEAEDAEKMESELKKKDSKAVPSHNVDDNIVIDNASEEIDNSDVYLYNNETTIEETCEFDNNQVISDSISNTVSEGDQLVEEDEYMSFEEFSKM